MVLDDDLDLDKGEKSLVEAYHQGVHRVHEISGL